MEKLVHDLQRSRKCKLSVEDAVLLREVNQSQTTRVKKKEELETTPPRNYEGIK